VLEAGKRENEKSWELPLEESYKEMLKSPVADLKNTAKKYGGAITAGLFLQEFVDNISWVHMDIAGPVWSEKGTDLIPKGASGIPVKTLLRFLMSE
jgi:leucyl aminopeptidase